MDNKNLEEFLQDILFSRLLLSCLVFFLGKKYDDDDATHSRLIPLDIDFLSLFLFLTVLFLYVFLDPLDALHKSVSVFTCHYKVSD